MRSCLKRTPPPSPPPLIPPLADSISARVHNHDDVLPSPSFSPSPFSPSIDPQPSTSNVASPTPSLQRCDSVASSSSSGGGRKSVKFCEEDSNQVWVADEWDRSPADVTPRLNYQSVFHSCNLSFTFLCMLRWPYVDGELHIPETCMLCAALSPCTGSAPERRFVRSLRSSIHPMAPVRVPSSVMHAIVARAERRTQLFPCNR